MDRPLLGELCWNLEALERPISHEEPSAAGVYNKALHVAERGKK